MHHKGSQIIIVALLFAQQSCRAPAPPGGTGARTWKGQLATGLCLWPLGFSCGHPALFLSPSAPLPRRGTGALVLQGPGHAELFAGEHGALAELTLLCFFPPVLGVSVTALFPLPKAQPFFLGTTSSTTSAGSIPPPA